MLKPIQVLRFWWILGVIVVAPRPAAAWAWRVHRLIAFRAAEALDWQLPLGHGAWKLLWRGAVAPDNNADPGHLPPQDHVYHVTPDRRGQHFGNGPRRVQELYWRLMSEEIPDDRFVFELARLCHLVGDLSQPLHADGSLRNPDEGRFHPLFEKAADEDDALASLHPAIPPTPPLAAAWLPDDAAKLDWESRMEALARESWRDYDAIGVAYRPGADPRCAGYPAVRAIVERRVERAVVVTVELWRKLLEKRGRAARLRHESGVWSCLAVPLVLLWFLYRGRVPEEEARYPGGGPPSDAERRRSDAAFRQLEERLGLERTGAR